MRKAKTLALIVIAVPIIYAAAMLYLMTHPKHVSEYTSGQYENLVLGENKTDLISRMKGSNHAFMPLPLNPDRDKNWVYMESMTEEEYTFLMDSNEWGGGHVGYSSGCGCPKSMLYFDKNKLAKVRVECWMCK